MTGQQYEAFCRFFLSHQLKISIHDITSPRIAAPGREGPAGYELQVDLYWEAEDQLARYVNVANAKWRRRSSVGQEDVLLLQKVKEKVGAHKAFLITNSGFTRGAVNAAQAAVPCPAIELTRAGPICQYPAVAPPAEALNCFPIAAPVVASSRAANAIPPGPGGYSTRQGGGPEFRTK
jgi:hypothetical protein